ncbi:MAG: glycosyltransferase family 1 protein, partial [Bacteroidota bacterium]
FHLMIPRMLKKVKADLFFSPEFYLATDTGIPQVPVFHDLAYEHYPKDLPAFASWYCRHFSPQYARKAQKILTVSEFSKQDISQRYQIPSEHIHVVYNGSNEIFQPLPDAEQTLVRESYTKGRPFFHYVGSIHPRKNIDGVLKAFDHFKKTTQSPVKLLIVGRKTWKYQQAMETFEEMEYQSDVIFSGFVPDEELARIYGASMGLVYVPHLEGFGIPVLEALNSDIPVITSNKTSLPEVAKDAGLLVDPQNTSAIADAMSQLYRSESLRMELIEKGRIQRRKFSWDQTYSAVWSELSSLLPPA